MSADLYNQIYEIVRLVPKGRVTTYGAIAKAIGSAKSARSVGAAMNHSHNPVYNVPAHRVVNGSGLLTGKFHFAYPEQMHELLEREGVTVINDQVQDFKAVFWDPLTEI